MDRSGASAFPGESVQDGQVWGLSVKVTVAAELYLHRPQSSIELEVNSTADCIGGIGLVASVHWQEEARSAFSVLMDMFYQPAFCTL